MESVSVGFWSVIPPLVAITLALLTKEVVFSLVLGILSGSVIYTLAADLPLISIFTTPVNLMLDKRIRVANMLPTIIFAAAFSFIPI